LFVETGPQYAPHVVLELMNLLPLPPKCWDYRREPPDLAKRTFLKNIRASLKAGKSSSAFRNIYI
jgi:hypothetical protein